MKEDFLTKFVGSQGLARVLRTFVLNPEEVFLLGTIAERSGIRERIARRELTELERAGLVKRGRKRVALPERKRARGKKKKNTKPKTRWESAWWWSREHPYQRAVSLFVREVSPAEYENISKALKKAGRISTVILSGAFMNDPSRPADILIAGEGLDSRRVDRAVRALEPMIGREIRYAAFSTAELHYRFNIQDRLVRDTVDYPHLILLDKAKIFLEHVAPQLAKSSV